MPLSRMPRIVAVTKRATMLRIAAERPGIDDRVVGIAVDVGDRREREVDADGAAFERGDPTHLVGVVFASAGADAHLGRKGRAANEPQRRPALEIAGDQEGEWRGALQGVQLRGNLGG